MDELFTFIGYIRKKYMLDNVLTMIEGLKSGVPSERLQSTIDPIGDFKLLNAVDLSNDMENLYQTVLIDSPVGEFFFKYLEQKSLGSSDAKENMRDFNSMQTYFQEETPELVRSSLNRIWIEMFHAHCRNLNEISQINMDYLLKLEADFQSIQVVFNSLDESNDKKEEIRSLLCPSLGHLYPLHFFKLKEAKTIEDLKACVEAFPIYKSILSEIRETTGNEDENDTYLEDAMFLEMTKAYSVSFDEQSNFSNFYAYVMLKEQEIKNVVWMAEMISRNREQNDPKWNKFLVPFDVLND